MSKLQQNLIVLNAYMLIMAAFCIIGLMFNIADLSDEVTELRYEIEFKNNQTQTLWAEVNSSKQINRELNEKNRELRGYTNFLESQNAMLMEKENEVSE